MSDVSNDDSDIQWNAVLELLRQGKTAEIPCENERDYARRTTKISKRAERKGIAVDVVRGEGVLRVAPRPFDGDAVTTPNAGEVAESERERQQRREARRAEREAGRSRDE
jgi:hypothetical protein